METKKSDPVKMVRQIRKKIYEETKNMSIAERMEYDRQINEKFEKEFAVVKPDYNRFPFLHKKEKIIK
jgi:hypothetical protein